MRVFMLMGLISIVPLSAALAADSDTHFVHYGDATPAPSNSMEYWDGGGYARNLLPMNLMDSRSNSQSGGPMSRQSRLDYSISQGNSTPQYSPDSSAQSDSLILHSGPAAASAQGGSQNSVQP